MEQNNLTKKLVIELKYFNHILVNDVSLITLSFNKFRPHMCTIVMFACSSNHEQSQRPSFINYDYKGVMCKICCGKFYLILMILNTV